MKVRFSIKTELKFKKYQKKSAGSLNVLSYWNDSQNYEDNFNGFNGFNNPADF